MELAIAPSRIESCPIDQLRPYFRNAKFHGYNQVAKIATSMAKIGWIAPCMIADDGELIAGHGRVLAASMLGLKDVSVIAAETTGRVCFGIELNPAYVDVAIERWRQVTCANAILAETGETFADLKANRIGA